MGAVIDVAAYKGVPVHNNRLDYFLKRVRETYAPEAKMNWGRLAKESGLDQSYFATIRRSKSLPCYAVAAKIDKTLQGNGRFIILAGYLPSMLSPTKSEMVFKFLMGDKSDA